MAKDKLDDIYEVVLFLKEKLVAHDTQFESVGHKFLSLEEKIEKNHQELIAKLDGVNRRVDNEVDKRKTIDVRVTKLEEKVFGK